MKVNGCGDSKRHLATVDGSEIRRENHLGCKKTLVRIPGYSPYQLIRRISSIDTMS